ncbi:MAG: NACHT domain-containing protein, partial [Proteobacteria bacterium]|nr:NACHT domain-containing protein [Pseudomonadota bacterium]
MKEQSPLKASLSASCSDNKSETKVKESKVRVDADTPSRFGEIIPQFSPNLEIKDETEFKKHPSPLGPPSLAYPKLQQTLQCAYRDKHSLLMPLSDKPFPIQAVSLTINRKSAQEERIRRQAQKLKKETKLGDKKSDQPDWSSQLQREEDWHKVKKPLEIKAIFTADKASHAKPIRRVLVEGRAGIGKTTFSQYIAWQWATTGLFHREYDYVLWVPLRRWLSGPVTEHFQEELAAFIFESYCPTDAPAERFKELQAILNPKQNTRTLLILDGFDEVAHYLEEPDSPHSKLL